MVNQQLVVCNPKVISISNMSLYQIIGVVTADTKTHFDLLKTIWFTLYSRIPGKVGSSAFEHVFMNEIKNNTIGGLHNWIWFYHKESEPGVKHSIDYQGYIKSLSLGTVSFFFVFLSFNKSMKMPEEKKMLCTIIFTISTFQLIYHFVYIFLLILFSYFYRREDNM